MIAGGRTAMPRLAERPLDVKEHGSSEVSWDDPKDVPSPRTLRRYARMIEKNLASLTKNNPASAKQVIEMLSNRLKKAIPDEDASVQSEPSTRDSDHEMVEGLRSFLIHNRRSTGTSENFRRNLETVIVAASWNEDVPTSTVAQALGIDPRTAARKRQIVQDCKKENKEYYPSKRRQRSDCVEVAARICVWSWCHTENASRVDAESRHLYSVLDPTTGDKVKHPGRVWNHGTILQRFDVFQQSDEYTNFRTQFGATIGKERFRTSICSCCRAKKDH